MRLLRARNFREQFANPTGWLGQLVGYAMAIKNARRSRWVISLLDLRAQSRVLEIGFGPGADIARMSRTAEEGLVGGVDRSLAMVRMASRRNRRAIERGQVELRHGSADALPFDDASFDRVVSINCVQFWPDVASGMREVKRVLMPGGLAVIGIQPRNAGANADTTRQWGERLETAMRALGFDDVRLVQMDTKPVPTVSAIGLRSQADISRRG